MKKRIVIPTLCFAMLSTPAFTKTVQTTEDNFPGRFLHPANVAAASSVKYVNVDPGSSLTLRSTASKTGAVLAKLPAGTSVTVYSTADGWAKVRALGKTGYVSAEYLSAGKVSTAPAKTVTKYVNVDPGSHLLLRKSAADNSAILGRLERGTSVKVLSVSGAWAKVAAGSKTGYVRAAYLSASKPGGASSGTPAPKTVTKYVNVDPGSHLLLRKSAADNSAILGRLERGTSVKVLSVSGAWAKVAAGSKTGYVRAAYLSASKPGGASSGSLPPKQ
ncbi:SH3 domain-containing protein [Heyndrickxia coagulans]|nr:SH3 domain-containing protein [Heyndrickxia coagulans]